MDDYEAHAGAQLVKLGTKELCDAPTLPMVLRLWIRNCPELIASQRDALAALAGQFTTRRNLVVASLYSTRMEGKGVAAGAAPAWLRCADPWCGGSFCDPQNRRQQRCERSDGRSVA